jgi:hypothetical protein
VGQSHFLMAMDTILTGCGSRDARDTWMIVTGQAERVLYRWSCSPTDPVTKLSQSHRNLANMDSHRKFS